MCGTGNPGSYLLWVRMGKEASKSITGSARQLGAAGARNERGRGVKEEDRRSQALGQQVSVWRQGMTDASVSAPTVATLWEQHRCLPPPPQTASSPLDRLWCGDNKTGAVLSAVKWPHWHSTTCGWGRGDGEVQASAQGLRRSQWQWGWGLYIWGSAHEDKGRALSLSCGCQLRHGVRGGPACEESRCFHSGVCQV